MFFRSPTELGWLLEQLNSHLQRLALATFRSMHEEPARKWEFLWVKYIEHCRCMWASWRDFQVIHFQKLIDGLPNEVCKSVSGIHLSLICSIQSSVCCSLSNSLLTSHTAHNSVVWKGWERNETLWKSPTQLWKPKIYSDSLNFPHGRNYGLRSSLVALIYCLGSGVMQVK